MERNEIMTEQKLVYFSVHGTDTKELPLEEYFAKDWRIVSYQCSQDGYKEGGFVIVLLEREKRYGRSQSSCDLPMILPL